MFLLKLIRRAIPLTGLLLVVTTLLAIPVFLKVNSETSADKFARKDTLVLNDDVQVHVIYPTELRVEPPDAMGRPITVWVTDNRPQPANIKYTVTISHDENLLFTNSAGYARPAQLDIMPGDLAQSHGMIYVRQAPLNRALPESVKIGIRVETPEMDKPVQRVGLPVALESTEQATWRLFIEFLANPEALPGLASVFVSLAALVVSLKVDRERKTRERRSLLESIYRLLETDVPNAIRQLLKVEEQAAHERWEESMERELRELRLRVEQNIHYQAQLLKGASDALRQDVEYQEQAADLLHLMVSFYHGELQQHVRVLERVFSATPYASVPSTQAVIAAALWLWNEYDEDAQEVVVQSLLWASRQTDGRELLRNAFTAGTSKERRLLRVPLLDDIVPDISSYRYEWPTLYPEQPQVVSASAPEPGTDEPALVRWLEQQALVAHPFGDGSAASGNLLLRSWVPPTRWKAIKSGVPMVITSEEAQDREIAARMMCHELQHDEPQRVFPVFHTHLCLSRLPDDPLHDPLLLCAWACGETWITLLAHNPGALLDLTEHERLALAELLMWVAGSLNALRIWLRQEGMDDNAAGRMLLRRIEELLGDERRPTTPARSKALSWLRLRPSGLHTTSIIVGCLDDSSRAAFWQQIQAMLALAPELAQARVMLKLFVPPLPPDIALPSLFSHVVLTWERDTLTTMLHTRVQVCSGSRYETFGVLFGPQPLEAADDMLVEKSQGSLSRMLQLGSAVIRMEVEGTSEHPYLEEEDLKAVLAQVRTATPYPMLHRLLPKMRGGMGNVATHIGRVWSSVRTRNQPGQ